MNLTDQTNNSPRKFSVIAAGVALVLCLAAVVVVRFQPYDPATPSDGETIIDYCLLAGAWLVPFASVCFAKRLLEGRRFRFALSWLVGFMIPWALLLYETFFPHVPPEGSYCTKAEECLHLAIVLAVMSGAINASDSLVERLLCKCRNRSLRVVAWLPLMWLFSVLILGAVFEILLMLKPVFANMLC